MAANILAEYRDTRVLVLGASGFIGRHVTRSLIQSGADLVVAVRRPEAMDGETLHDQPLYVDLLDFRSVSALIRRVNPMVLFNLAGYGINPRERDEEIARAINAELPPFLLHSLLPATGTAWTGHRLIHAGTAFEYGSCGGDLVESSTPAPKSLYGQTKLAGTSELSKASLSTGIGAVTARIFTAYGPGERAGRLLPSLMQAARTGGKLHLTAGTQKRDFIHVGDVVEGLLRLGAAKSTQGEVVNLATGVLSTVRHFIEVAAEVLGITADQLQFAALPVRPEEMEHDPVSIRKLKSLVSWAPPVSISEGILKTQALAR